MLVWGVVHTAFAVEHQITACAGDCNEDGVVTLDEIIKAVNIALGTDVPSHCASADLNGDDKVVVGEIIAAVNAGLSGCPVTPTPTQTATESPTLTATPTPTETVIPPPRVVFTGACYQPGSGRDRGLDPCAPGTLIRCLDAGQSTIGRGSVDAQGEFAVVTPGALAVSPLTFIAPLSGIDYRLILDFAPIRATAASVSDGPALSVRGQVIPPDVIISGVVIDPISEAGAQVLDRVGLRADQAILDSVRRANGKTNFALQTPADAAASATNVAVNDHGVERAICGSRPPGAGVQTPGDGGAAFVALAVGPTFPSFVQVGQVNVAVSLTVINASTAPESGGSMAISQIRLTPACGTDATFVCPQGFEDPSVFRVKGTDVTNKAQGRVGTACGDPNVPGGMTFTIGPPSAITGQVEFIPDSGVVVLASPSGIYSSCTIDFFVDVLSLPIHSASPLPPGARASLSSVFACGISVVGVETTPAVGEAMVTIGATPPGQMR